MSGDVINILTLAELHEALIKGFGRYHRRPSRIVACPVQVMRWRDDCGMILRMTGGGVPEVLNIMGVPVSPGPSDAKPELIWAEPI